MFASIVAIWVAVLLLAVKTDADGLFLAVLVLVMTILLFLIGFQRGR